MPVTAGAGSQVPEIHPHGRARRGDRLASVSSKAHDDEPMRFRVTAPPVGKRSTDIRWSKRRCVLSFGTTTAVQQ
jgi:hypothetical protein